MKKIVLIILAIFFIAPVFAEYKPIPKELSEKYKAEMERIISENYNKAIEYIDDYFNDIKEKYDTILKYGCNENISLYTEVSIFDLDLFIYSKLMEVTQENYLGLKYKPFGSDSTTPWSEYLYRYFKDNNVNTKKLRLIGKYAKNKNKKIERYQRRVNKMCFEY